MSTPSRMSAVLAALLVTTWLNGVPLEFAEEYTRRSVEFA